MVKATRGSLLPSPALLTPLTTRKRAQECSDAAVKQILLQLDETAGSRDRFIIADLDDTHLLIAPEAVERVREDLEAHLETNFFQQGGDEE
ncbi:hypothetical protein JCM5296_002541 [Sporobolomyces johnsonii]